MTQIDEVFEKQFSFCDKGFLLADFYDKFRKSVVFVLGCGGLGNATSQILARSGIGNLVLVDFDLVERSNLSRQVLFSSDDVGKAKCDCLKRHISEGFPNVNIFAINEKITKESIKNIFEKGLFSLVGSCDVSDFSERVVVCDCLDNFESRLFVSEFSSQFKIPVVHAMVSSSKGFVFPVLQKKGWPSFVDVFSKKRMADSVKSKGVLNNAVFATSSVQAGFVFKILSENLDRAFAVDFDMWNFRFDVVFMGDGNEF